MNQKKSNDEYEEPKSHKLGGDDLEDISGGSDPECSSGQTAAKGCSAGQHPVSTGCLSGGIAKPNGCAEGNIAGAACSVGKMVG